jgi:AAA15 family ATPase/GTPase
MKIKSLQLKNFKRFTDLTLKEIPEKARVVLLIGSNGSGKSSVFDAFEYLSNQNGKAWKQANLEFRKDASTPESIIFETYDYGEEGIINKAWKRSNKLNAYSFYGRTSFRQVPRLTKTNLGTQFNIEGDDDRAASFIDRDVRFENDLEHLFGKLLKEFFKTNDDKSEIKEKVINPINASLERIFNKSNGTKLQLIEIIPPLEGKVAEINFKKGESSFHYNYLSAGEKEVFNILINLVARVEYYKETVFYFDEIDLHLNTRLQYNFIKEITEYWIPNNCQFWTASHSLGFIQYAKESEDAVILDFDDYDFDKPRILVPEPKDNPNLYQIAVDKELLSSLFKDFAIVFVENTDKKHYASLAIPSTIFIPENGRNGVYHKTKEENYSGLVDRDFLSDDDITEIEKQYKTLGILRYYSIENYLYHPDNLQEYCKNIGKAFDKPGYIEKIIESKNSIKDQVIPNISLKRTEYPYFGEPAFNGKANQNRFKNKKENSEQSSIVAGYLNSDIFEIFYKVFPMKSYATHLSERQHIAKTDLSKTNWFKSQIEKLLRQ